MHATQLATIDSLDLALVTGGDGWSDYKNTVSQNWNQTVDRAQQTWNNARQGNWGAAADNAGGTAYNAMQTFNSAVSPWLPVVGTPGGGGRK